MAIVDDKYILKIDRQRAGLIRLLQSKGVLIDNDADLDTAIGMVEKIGQNDLLYDFIQGRSTRVDLLDENVTTLDSLDPFASSRATLTHINAPYITNIKALFGSAGNNSSFGGSQVQHINFPQLVHLGVSYSLSYMPLLKNIVLENVTSCVANGLGIINGNSALLRFIAPKLFIAINTRLSVGLSNLAIIDVTLFRSGGDYPALKTLILRDTTTISTLSASKNVPEDAEIYVPQSMIATYQSATNWTTYADNFIPLEGSKYESLDWYKTEDWYLEEMAVWQ